MKLTDTLRSIEAGTTKIIKFDSFAKVQTIRTILYRLAKNNPKDYNFFTRTLGKEIHITNSTTKSMSKTLRGLKKDRKFLYPIELYDHLHSTIHEIEKRGKNEFEVKKVTQVIRKK